MLFCGPHNTNTTPSHWNVKAGKFHIAKRPSHSRSQKAISRSILHCDIDCKSQPSGRLALGEGHILELRGMKSIMEVLLVLKRVFIMISLTMLDCCRVVMAWTTFSAEYNANLDCIGCAGLANSKSSSHLKFQEGEKNWIIWAPC